MEAAVRCQQQDTRSFSRLSLPYAVFLVYRLLWRLRHTGVVATVRKVLEFTRGRRIDGGTQRSLSAVLLPHPPLQPGEWVEVKSEHEIRATLDSSDRNKGLAFLPEMARDCGRRFRVHKRVERIFLEESKQRRRTRNTVILEQSMCDGTGIGCDRSCFYFWREAWLKRVPADQERA